MLLYWKVKLICSSQMFVWSLLEMVDNLEISLSWMVTDMLPILYWNPFSDFSQYWRLLSTKLISQEFKDFERIVKSCFSKRFSGDIKTLTIDGIGNCVLVQSWSLFPYHGVRCSSVMSNTWIIDKTICSLSYS